jgi:hypothetical protein
MISGYSQPLKTDLERETLKGPVKTVTSYYSQSNPVKDVVNFNDSIGDGVITTSFDTLGFIRQRVSQYHNAEESGLRTRFEVYTYTDNYQRLTKNEYAEHDSLLRSVQTEFDLNGNIKRTTEFTPDGELIKWSLHTYAQENQNETHMTEYDLKGKVTGTWLFHRNATKDTLYSTKLGKNGKMLYGYQFIYDAHGNQLSFIHLDKNHNVFSKTEYTYQSYDEQGNWTKRTIKHSWLDKKTLKWNKKVNIPPTTYKTQIRTIEYYE